LAININKLPAEEKDALEVSRIYCYGLLFRFGTYLMAISDFEYQGGNGEHAANERRHQTKCHQSHELKTRRDQVISKKIRRSRLELQ
jgi:hypothetical protein